MDFSSFLDQYGFIVGITLGAGVAAIAVARNRARRRREQ